MNEQDKSRGTVTANIIRTPRSVDIEITSRCNLRCRYCYYFDNAAVPYEDLPTDEWLTFFEELGRCRVMDVTLQGGEPFMRKDLRLIIEGIVSNRMRFSILTNGTLIQEDMVAFIAGTGRCDRIQVSIDGSRPEIHDATRGEGSFAKAVEAIHLLQRGGIKVDVRVTLSRHNLPDLENTTRFLLEDLHLPNFGINSVGYLGTCRQHANELLLDTTQRMQAMQILRKLSKRYDGRITAQAGPLADARTWSDMEFARKQNAPPFPGGGCLTGCGCVFTKMAVRGDGTLVPCVLLAHMELGHINRDSIDEVWLDSPKMRELRQRQDTRLEDFAFCAGCQYTPYCTGNCPALAHALRGEVNHPSPDACLRSFLAEGGRMEVQA